MKIQWFVLALALSSVFSFSEDQKALDDRFWKLIDKLNDDDYQAREDVSHMLSRFPSEYVRKLLQVSANDKRPEVKSRAFQAAFKCYCLTILPEDERWRSAFGTLGVTANFRWDRKPAPEKDVLLGMEVAFVEWQGVADGKLKEDDLIVEVDGKEPNGVGNGQILANQEYVLTVFRPKDGKVEKLSIKIKAGWSTTPAGFEADELMDKCWKQFREGKPPESAGSRAEVVPEDEWFRDVDFPLPPLMPFPPIIGPQLPPK